MDVLRENMQIVGKTEEDEEDRERLRTMIRCGDFQKRLGKVKRVGRRHSCLFLETEAQFDRKKMDSISWINGWKNRMIER